MAQRLPMVCKYKQRFQIIDMTLIQRSWSHILKTSLQLVMRISLSFYDRECSYLAHLLSLLCELQRKFQITALTLESKDKAKYVTIIYLIT